jgi:hypothetical protein
MARARCNLDVDEVASAGGSSATAPANISSTTNLPPERHPRIVPRHRRGRRCLQRDRAGRVAALLEANPEERRLIFEEAAGISKYKVKKKEAQRKLERVDQNLLRVNDIVEEVEKRCAA